MNASAEVKCMYYNGAGYVVRRDFGSIRVGIRQGGAGAGKPAGIGFKVNTYRDASEQVGDVYAVEIPAAGSVPGCCENGVSECWQHGYGEYIGAAERLADGPCVCFPGVVCDMCAARGYRNGLAGYAARIFPEMVTADDIAEQDRADREAEIDALGELGVHG